MFNILSRSQSIHRSYFLEASAGTGKTFSIVHLTVRQLLEVDPNLNRPLELEELLLVTFTRASTRELKQRLNDLIVLTTHHLEDALNASISENLPDYLLSIIEAGPLAIQEALMRLERATILFDRAQIFTIHSFCYQMLQEFAFEAKIFLGNGSEEDPFAGDLIYQFARDFLRCREYCPVTPTLLPGQFKALAQSYRYQVPQLLHDLIDYATSSEKILCRSHLRELMAQFEGALTSLKEFFGNNGQMLQDQLSLLLSYYKRSSDRQGNLTPTHQYGIELFCQFLFAPFHPKAMDELFSLPIFTKWLTLVDPQNRAVRKKGLEDNSTLFYLQNFIQNVLMPLLKEIYDPLHTFAYLANQFQMVLVQAVASQRMIGPNEVLFAMRHGLEKEKFLAAVQKRYRMAIIDEFQDTDAVQWGIFCRLFLTHKHRLCLVGDPKQSIYAFRRADIYTYFAALDQVGIESRASLTVNYRSHEELVRGLNQLFSSSRVAHLFPLPKIQSHLLYHPIDAGIKNDGEEFPLPHRRIHFMLAEGVARGRFWPPVELEERCLLPAIVKEIQELERLNVKKRQCALLVRDRYQAARAKALLATHGIPSTTRRSSHIADGLAIHEILAALFATREPYYASYLYPFLSSRLVGLTLTELAQMRSSQASKELLFPWYEYLAHLQTILYSSGITRWLEVLLQHKNPRGDTSFYHRLLGEEDGQDYISEVHQVSDALLTLSSNHHFSLDQQTLEQQIYWLSRLAAKELGAQVKKIQSCQVDAVEIITLHMSKGLEFEYVFAIGLSNRTHDSHSLLLEPTEETIAFTPYITPEMLADYYQEANAEKMRQLYVAMTRAKECLYLPIALPSPSSIEKEALLDLPSASPIELFLQHHLDSQLGPGFLVDYPTVLELLQKLGEEGAISFESCPSVPAATGSIIENKSPPQLHPVQLNLPESVPLYTSSYTSLTRRQHTGRISDEYRDTKEVRPTPSIPTIPDPNRLPAGRHSGIILHQILQEIDLTLLSIEKEAHDREKFLSGLLRGTPLQTHQSQVDQILADVGKMLLPLQGGFQPFYALADHSVYREMEFLFPSDKAQTWWTRLSHVPGMIAGVIDFIFIHEGWIYVIDWKSNDLGDEIEAYAPAALFQEMCAASYDLQAELYAYAMHNFITLLRSRGYEIRGFGGTFYVFLRGLKLVSQEQYGIYHLAS